MNKVQQDDIYSCPILEPKIFEFERYDQQGQQSNGNDHSSTSSSSQAEYTIVQDHSHKISSSVWKYFGSLKKNDELVDPNHVYCSQCFEDRKTKKYQKSTSTGNLLKHLKKAHFICLDAPQFRVKREKNGLIVTKSEVIGAYDNIQYLDTTNGNYIPIATGGVASQTESESEYLVHDIHEILIAEVAKRPPIYDASLCKKNKKQIRRELWNEIHVALNELVPLEKLPKVWKNIRDRYHKIKKDIDRGSQQKPKYRYFHLLQFLDNVESKQVFASVPNESFSTNYIMHNFDSDDADHQHHHHHNVAIENDQGDFVGCTTGEDDPKQIENVLEKFKTELYHPVDDGNEPLVKKIKLNQDDSSNDGDEDIEVPVDHHFDTVPSSLLTNDSIIKPSSPLHTSQQLQQHQPQIQSQTTTCNQIIDKTTILTDDTGSPLITGDFTTTEQSPITLSACIPAISGTTNITAAATANILKQADEFDIFGNFVGQVMRNMAKSKARLLQMKVLQLITEFDE